MSFSLVALRLYIQPLRKEILSLSKVSVFFKSWIVAFEFITIIIGNRNRRIEELDKISARELPRAGVVTGKVMALFQMLASMDLMEPVNFSASMGKLFFDTAGDPMPEQFDILLKIASLDQIIFGTDYPYVPAQVVLGRKKLFDAELKRHGLTGKIYVENARMLLEI